jgi:hypothetical protein
MNGRAKFFTKLKSRNLKERGVWEHFIDIMCKNLDWIHLVPE